jgi:hypothetical protein
MSALPLILDSKALTEAQQRLLALVVVTIILF